MKQSSRVFTQRSALWLAFTFITAAPATAMAAPNYGEALQKSIYFYEAQQSGHLPDWNRVEWRGDATVNDGSDVGLDLSGGWYDAGDHVKFGFPMAASATLLAWGVVENPQAYEAAGQLEHIRNNLRFVADYFVAAHPDANTFYGQVGNGSSDHAWWGPVEVLEATGKATATRPSYAITPACPGSDIAGETSAALAAIAMVFADNDPAYSASLLSHARSLYTLAVSYPGKYSDCITDAAGFYNSWSGYQDELVWSAAWLYRATGEQQYLNAASSRYNNLGTSSDGVKAYQWTHAWDDKSYGSYVLMAALTGNSQYRADAERWLDYWTTGYNGQRVPYTSGGLAQRDQWGASRYAANTAWIALVYSDYLKRTDPNNSRINTYYQFAVSQLEYLLGDNPMGIPYQIGLSEDGPKNPHHRTSHGSWSDSINSPTDNRHLLIGALVGGPGSGDSYSDDRSDYIANEVATDYNAGFTSALARLYLDFGGSPIPDDQFPPAETRDNEFYVEAAVNASGNRFVELKTRVYNHSAWPANVTDQLSMRYWVDLSAETAAGYQASDITVSSGYSQATSISALQSWGNPDDHIYYVDISFAGISLFPGSESDSSKEVQFRLSLPTSNNNADWDNSADPSWDNYSSTLTITDRIALYDNGELIWGEEPGAACGAATGINCLPDATDLNVTTAYDTPIDITLAGNDDDGEINAYVMIDAPAHGTLDTSNLNSGVVVYTPTAGYFGADQFSYQVIDNSNAHSSTASVAITVEEPVIPAVSIQSPLNGTTIEAGADFIVELSYSNAASVNVAINGTVVQSAVTLNRITLQAPETTGNFTLTLTALDAHGEVLDASSSVALTAVEPQPNQAPEAAFVSNISFLNATFNASGSTDADGDSLSWSWDFGDNSSATGVTAQHTYSHAGTWTVTLTVSDGEDSTTISRDITTTEAANGEVSCTLGSTDSWNNGAVLNNIRVNNLGDTSTDWQVIIPVTGVTAITNSWNATVVLSDNRIIASGSNLAAGGQQLFGLQLSHSGSVTASGCYTSTSDIPDNNSSDDNSSDDNSSDDNNSSDDDNSSDDNNSSDDDNSSDENNSSDDDNSSDDNSSDDNSSDDNSSDDNSSDDNNSSDDDNSSGDSSACSFAIRSEWNQGFTAEVTITNTSNSTMDGWTVGMNFTDGSTLANGWSALFTSNGSSVRATAMSWNSSIAPGASVTFGFNGNKAVTNQAASAPVFSGSACQ